MTHNPGSDAARAKGCTCPVFDNGRGTGTLGEAQGWVYAYDCPVHCPKAAEPGTSVAVGVLAAVVNQLEDRR